ncbi:MAG: 16S rRNA (uracil(1498)-N(3))-methyltransferase [Acidobacteria bacterium]|nr:16S rRNA (uracil(1498)-N(3))-methyltransferase [Acidobacteriota bacterium]
MQRHRFYAAPNRFSDSRVHLDNDQSYHLWRVLRLRAGAPVFVFDGLGKEWECRVLSAGKDGAELEIIQQVTTVVESPLQITLAQALIKSDRFDWVVQKTTELGVARIVPLITVHNSIFRAEEHGKKQLERWHRISLEALKQCGRRKLVEIIEPISLAIFCEKREAESINLMFSERSGRRLNEINEIRESLQPNGKINLMIAAEGGWSDQELQTAEAFHLMPVHLGARILRSETAAIVAVSLVQSLFGDL